jgi:hypothetical protein
VSSPALDSRSLDRHLTPTERRVAERLRVQQGDRWRCSSASRPSGPTRVYAGRSVASVASGHHRQADQAARLRVGTAPPRPAHLGSERRWPTSRPPTSRLKERPIGSCGEARRTRLRVGAPGDGHQCRLPRSAVPQTCPGRLTQPCRAGSPEHPGALYSSAFTRLHSTSLETVGEPCGGRGRMFESCRAHSWKTPHGGVFVSLEGESFAAVALGPPQSGYFAGHPVMQETGIALGNEAHVLDELSSLPDRAARASPGGSSSYRKAAGGAGWFSNPN